jgi:hypothetical protein
MTFSGPVRAVATVAALVVTTTVAGACGRSPGQSAGAPAAPGGAAAGVVEVHADAGVATDWAAVVRRDVAAALAPVAAVVPGAWTQRVDVTLVGSDDRLRAEAGWRATDGGPAGTVAAVAVLPIGGAGPAATGADPGGRLVVDLAVYQRLTTAGRRIVLRHELTHLATAADTPAGMPVWLVEGFAEEVGHEGVVACSAGFGPVPGGPGCPAGSAAAALPVAAAAGELAAEVRAGAVPAGLPGDAAFDGADGRLAQTYQESWLACRLLAQRLGLPGLARYYRDVARRLGTPAAPARQTGAGAATGAGPTTGAGEVTGAAAALRAVTGLSWAEFVATWRAFLVTLLGVPAGG